MKTIKVAETTEPQLDWLVAKCEGLPLRFDPMGFKKDAPDSAEAGWWLWLAQPGSMLIGPGGDTMDRRRYSPSTNWAQGGPLTEREGISTVFHEQGHWTASNLHGTVCGEGPTPLIAAMRVHVYSKLGETAEVPEELV